MLRLRNVGTDRLFCNDTGTVMVGTLYEFAYKTLNVQRTAVNEELCNCA